MRMGERLVHGKKKPKNYHVFITRRGGKGRWGRKKMREGGGKGDPEERLTKINEKSEIKPAQESNSTHYSRKGIEKKRPTKGGAISQ